MELSFSHKQVDSPHTYLVNYSVQVEAHTNVNLKPQLALSQRSHLHNEFRHWFRTLVKWHILLDNWRQSLSAVAMAKSRTLAEWHSFSAEQQKPVCH